MEGYAAHNWICDGQHCCSFSQLALLLHLCQTLTSLMPLPLEPILTQLLGWRQQPRLQVSTKWMFLFICIFMLCFAFERLRTWLAISHASTTWNSFLRTHSGSAAVLWSSLGRVPSQSFPATACIICKSLSQSASIQSGTRARPATGRSSYILSGRCSLILFLQLWS